MSGTAFLDSNQDGIKGKGEIALPGQTLYIDYNGNGTFDDGDVSTVTDGSGNYRFKVPVDSYRIRMVIPQGYHATGVGFADSIFKKSVASGMNLGIAVG